MHRCVPAASQAEFALKLATSEADMAAINSTHIMRMHSWLTRAHTAGVRVAGWRTDGQLQHGPEFASDVEEDDW